MSGQRNSMCEGLEGAWTIQMEEVKEDQRNGRKEQQEVWLKRWGGEGGIQQTYSPI